MALILTWDGNTTGRTEFTSFEKGVSGIWNAYLYKVSDEVITYADISEKFIIGDSHSGNSTVSNLKGADVQDFGSAVFIHYSGAKEWVISGHPGDYVATVYYDNTFTIPESGTYFAGPNSINSHYTNYFEIPSYSRPTITGLTMNDTPISLARGESFQFTLKATYDDGTIEDVTSVASWGLGNDTIEEPVSELNGCTISSSGLLTAIDPTSPTIVVSGKFGGLGAYTTVTISGSSNPYESGGFSGSGGGGGTFPSDPGPSLVDQIPAGQTGNDLANSGLFTMYLMNQQYMNLIGNIMWEDNLGIQALKAVFGQPIDAIISTMSYPFDLTNFVSKVAQNLYFGPWNSGLPFQALTKSSFQINWGTINIPFGWGNFLDYAPYTKMELFLPWGPGYVPIDPNDVSPFSNTPGNFNVSTFTNGSIQVKTNIELGKGTCVHNVIGNNGRVIGSYSGVVGKQVPMTALDTGGKALTTIGAVAAVATAGASTAATAASGGFNKIVHGGLTPISGGQGMAMHAYSVLDPSAVASGFASNVGNSSAANMASRALFNTPLAYPRAGTFSDGSSAMTVQEPFLIISRPVQSVPTQYGHYNGYPSNIYVANLNAVSGYTELSEIHLDNVTATADELQELDAILKGGILL